MSCILSAIVVLVLTFAAWAGAQLPSARWPLAVLVPAGGAVLFLAGVAWRVLSWANSPVPFRIPVTCGQQASLQRL